MPTRIPFHKIEFYITNVCNLACEDCNRFNDYNFKGWQAWDDYADIYAEWSKLISIEQPKILGGEPLLNPSVMSWVDGINSLWNRSVQILTNGTRLNQVNGLYERMKDHRCWVGVSLHNIDEADYIADQITSLLEDPVQKIPGDDPDPFIKRYNASYVFANSARMRIPVWTQNEFTPSAITRNQQGNLTLHQNDPIAAHNVCGFAQNKNYHFIRGKLYKCGPAALFPEFDEQFHLALSDNDRDLVNSYRPLTLENFAEYHKEFFAELDNPIPQCKFCPVQITSKLIHPILKKK